MIQTLNDWLVAQSLQSIKAFFLPMCVTHRVQYSEYNSWFKSDECSR